MASSTSSLDPPMENDWEYRHGRVDPGQDENLNLLESVPVTGPEEGELEQRNNLSLSKDKSESSNVPQRGLLGMSSDSSLRISENILVSASVEFHNTLLFLKTYLIHCPIQIYPCPTEVHFCVFRPS